jgi:hypothetical protein
VLENLPCDNYVKAPIFEIEWFFRVGPDGLNPELRRLT